MGLTDDQIFDLNLDLVDALIKAFTTEEDLNLMVKRSLRTPLNKIKQNAQGYEATVDKVVEWAMANGKLRALVIGASQRNADNPNLKKFSEERVCKIICVNSQNQDQMY